MKLAGTAVAGSGIVRFGNHRPRSTAELARDAGLAALHDAGMTLADVDEAFVGYIQPCLLYTSPSPRDRQKSRMPSSA